MAAILVRDPFRLSLAEISRLTHWHLQAVYFRPRDKEDRLVRPARPAAVTLEPTPATFRDLYYSRLLTAGYSREYADRRWAAYLEHNPGLKGS